MISRPMPGTPVARPVGHSEEPLTPLPYQMSKASMGGYPSPVRRTKSYGFRPRLLPPVNKVVGPPRMYG